MSLPPATVKIKRKATDDPVEFLRIHEADGKKRRGSGFIFSRQPAGNQSTASQPASPGLRHIKQLPQSASSPALQSSGVAPDSPVNTTPGEDEAQLPSTLSPNTPPLNSSAPIPPRVAPPRRFHISRSATPSNPQPPTAAGGRKRKAETVFVERRIRPQSADGTPGRIPSTPVKEITTEDQNKDNNVPGQHADVQHVPTPTPEAEKPRPQKKPGENARRSIPPAQLAPAPPLAPAPLRNVVMPSGLIMPWDANLDRLAAEMQAYTLQEIGKNIAQSEAERPKPISHRINKTPSKFKPKKPALRYLERHPEERVDTVMDVDADYMDEEVDDDGEYIIDTYVRVPADALETQESHKNIGLLILDSQPDIDEFYKEEEDSDEEEDDEDEDENAENHYTADYPDEEVDSDDEYDRNAYHYRTHNASDLEEFDENDATFSDDEESTKYPWMRNRG